MDDMSPIGPGSQIPGFTHSGRVSDAGDGAYPVHKMPTYNHPPSPNGPGPDELPPAGTLAGAVARVLKGEEYRGIMGPFMYENGGAKLFTSITQDNGVHDDGDYAEHFGTEARLIQAHAKQIAALAVDYDDIIIVGPGPAHSVKTKELPIIHEILKATSDKKTIHIVELSSVFKAAAEATVSAELAGYAHAEVTAHQADFRKILTPAGPKGALVICTGSLMNLERPTIESFPSQEMKAHLSAFSRLAGAGGMVVLGYDSCNDSTKLLDAYNTEEVSKFVTYPLKKVGADEMFKYTPKWRNEASTLVHYWEAVKDGVVSLPYQTPEGEQAVAEIDVFKGDRYVPFVSVKPDPIRLAQLATRVAMDTETILRQDTQALHVFRVRQPVGPALGPAAPAA